MKQKVEITFEVGETIILRQSGNRLEAFCQQCQASVVMTTPQHAALFLGSEFQIFRLIEAGLSLNCKCAETQLSFFLLLIQAHYPNITRVAPPRVE